MSRWLLKLSEWVLLALIALVALLPLSLTLMRTSPNHFSWVPFLKHRWVKNTTLSGATIATPEVLFSWSALAAGEFQKSKENRFNERFAGREALIRVTNEAWFQLFRRTATVESTMEIGRDGSLFEKDYLREYFLRRTEKHKLAPWVTDLRRLQNACRMRGMGFAVVITPSKAATYPDTTPRDWERFRDPRPRGYDQLVELFREQGIEFADGPALIAQELAANPPPAPLFPKGGIHWSQRAASLATNAVHAVFRRQGKPLEPLHVTSRGVSDKPVGEDCDLLSLMNLVHPWRYPCERVTIQPTFRPPSEQLTMAVVGGSFGGELCRQLSATGQISKVHRYSYYKLSVDLVAKGRSTQVRKPATPVDFENEIFSTDCLLLEINEAVAYMNDHHLAEFVNDALAHLSGR